MTHEVAAANTRQLRMPIELGARNIAHPQHAGELPGNRDPELLAAATLGGTKALISTALIRTPRPPAEDLIDQLWSFVSGAVGLAAPPTSWPSPPSTASHGSGPKRHSLSTTRDTVGVVPEGTRRMLGYSIPPSSGWLTACTPSACSIPPPEYSARLHPVLAMPDRHRQHRTRDRRRRDRTALPSILFALHTGHS
ncbi:hypothetical protein YWIDRAFT_08028 [Streptomyces sp. SceaMP-e96]|uniref:hypothetical protein n=1 Tax=Streptomyces TaxID=1883 RepID=UPI000823EFB1|nr:MULTISPECIES: hypothetical protein [unclassified Streptomyces]SCK54533.1 hypothetical protein YWIDRAFT_08028 [Streptomyces sp. SceaMP-e96]